MPSQDILYYALEKFKKLDLEISKRVKIIS